MNTITKAQFSTRNRDKEVVSYRNMPALMSFLSAREDSSVFLIKFIILTAVRPNEAFGATCDEINFDTGIWTIPANRMKTRIQHVIPLSMQARELIERLPIISGTSCLFKDNQQTLFPKEQISNILRRLGYSLYVRRLRTAFREWATDEPRFDEMLAGKALGDIVHITMSMTESEAHFIRAAMIEKRRELMQAWADFLESPQ